MSVQEIGVAPLLDFPVPISESEPASIVVVAGRSIHPLPGLIGIANKPAIVNGLWVLVDRHEALGGTRRGDVGLFAELAQGGGRVTLVTVPAFVPARIRRFERI